MNILVSCLTCGAPYENSLNQCPYCGGVKTKENEIENNKTSDIAKLLKLAFFEMKNQNYYNAISHLDEIVKVDSNQKYAWFLKIKCELLTSFSFKPKQANQFENNQKVLRKFVDNCEHYLSHFNSPIIYDELTQLICKILDCQIEVLGKDIIHSYLEEMWTPFLKALILKIPQSKLSKFAYYYKYPIDFIILLLENNLLPQVDLINILNEDSQWPSPAAAGRLAILFPYINNDKIKYINQFIISKNNYYIKEINDDYYKENLTKRERINNEIKSFSSNFIAEFQNCEIDSVDIQKSLDSHLTVIKKLNNAKEEVAL